MRLSRLIASCTLALAVVAAPAPAEAAACTDSAGVTVVVDFGRLGGGVQVRCARTSGSGLDALQVAGFAVTGTQRYGTAFVCRINGKPDPSAETCVNTPPADSSWRYFHATNGGSWTYSQSGASARQVVQGGFEGWSFGAGTTPRFKPYRAASAGGSGSGGTPGSTVDPSAPSSSDDTALPPPRPRKSAAVTANPSATPSAVSGEDNAASADVSSGSSVSPWVGGAALLALLAVLGLVVAQRRRRDAS